VTRRPDMEGGKVPRRAVLAVIKDIEKRRPHRVKIELSAKFEALLPEKFQSNNGR